MDDSIRILVVDDEADIRRIIRILLESRGYRVLEAPNGRLAVETIRKEPDIDLILLDIMMPELSGIEASREIRSISSAPILFLTARTQEQDKLEAYSSGGDDYLAKPFHLAELEARIRSLTRRQFTQNDVVLSCGDLAFDTKARTASVAGQALTLTRKETGILEYLLLNKGRPVSQEELIDHVWDNSVDNFSNSIRVHISSLRKKLRAALGYDPIRNRIGEGYVMEENSI